MGVYHRVLKCEGLVHYSTVKIANIENKTNLNKQLICLTFTLVMLESRTCSTRNLIK